MNVKIFSFPNRSTDTWDGLKEDVARTKNIRGSSRIKVDMETR